jgi:hypothetical protein
MTEEHLTVTPSEEIPAQSAEPAAPPASPPAPAPARPAWQRAAELGLRGLVYLLLTAAVITVALVARERILGSQAPQATGPAPLAAEAQPEVRKAAQALSVELAPLAAAPAAVENSITRLTTLHTTVPARPRVDVITYTVETGDTLFVIADRFGLKPETILWGNFETLEDNPHLLRPDQVLNILPVNGTYYQWSEGDSLTKVADFFEVDAQKILEYPGNRFDLTAAIDSISLQTGDWLIVPDGKRAIKDWGPPAISRSNPAAARYYGPGHCGSIYSGAIGTYTFVWPTTARSISGYNYNPGVHPAIDIAGAEGNPVFATDSGVVVYAGWSNYGYGYLVVIDHGTGWQSAYAHLSAISVGCGQSVFQGGGIGAVGNTGNSYGSHLHFELVYNGAKVNPLDFLP